MSLRDGIIACPHILSRIEFRLFGFHAVKVACESCVDSGVPSPTQASLLPVISAPILFGITVPVVLLLVR